MASIDGKHIKQIAGEKTILSGTGPNRLKKNQIGIEKEGSTYRLAFRDEQNEYRTTAFPGEIIGVTGPQGFTGLVGPTGVEGPVGPVGPQGETGVRGVRGFQGDQGLVGETGVRGPTGHGGITGLKGEPFEADEVGILDEAKVSSIEATSGASPTNPFYYAIIDDQRSNPALPAGICGDMDLRLAMWAGTCGEWVDWGHYIGTPDIIRANTIYADDVNSNSIISGSIDVTTAQVCGNLTVDSDIGATDINANNLFINDIEGSIATFLALNICAPGLGLVVDNNATISGTLNAGTINVSTLNATSVQYSSAHVCGNFLVDQDIYCRDIFARDILGNIGTFLAVSICAPGLGLVVDSRASIGDKITVTNNIESSTGDLKALSGNISATGSITGGAGSLTSLNMNLGNISSANAVSATDLIAGNYLSAPGFVVDSCGVVANATVTICGGELVTESIQPASVTPFIGSISNRYGNVYANLFNAATAVVSLGGMTSTTGLTVTAGGGTFAGNLIPNVTATHSIGTSTSLRWNKIWAVDMDISGTFSSSIMSATDIIAGTYLQAPGFIVDACGVVANATVTICGGELVTEFIQPSTVTPFIGSSSNRYGNVYVNLFNAARGVVSAG